MHDPNQGLIEAALRLPEPLRADLAAVLLDSIGPEIEGETDFEISTEELRRRLAEARANPEASLSWSELRDQG